MNIYEACMSTALNGSSVIWRFEGSDAIEIRNEITFNFYTGLPHVVGSHYTLSAQTIPTDVTLPPSTLLSYNQTKRVTFVSQLSSPDLIWHTNVHHVQCDVWES